MAIKRMPIADFVKELEAALERKDGYIMGSKGQNPKKWATDSWWFTQYSGSQKTKALYWREHAERVWDCNGMAEGIYEDFSGVNINSKARYNHAYWCETKGSGTIPVQYRVPGAAVFIYSSSAGYIVHVGYLNKPVIPSNNDWWVIEARGVMYGVVRTLLSKRGWNRWGLMEKYFDYGDIGGEVKPLALGDRTLRNGDDGDDVAELQRDLVRLGYDCGKYGADGDFGDATELAVMAFQRDHECDADGIYGAKSHEAMVKALADLDNNDKVINPTTVTIVGGTCWIRTLPGTEGDKLGTAKSGTQLPYTGKTAENGWNEVVYNDKNGWVSGKYSEVK